MTIGLPPFRALGAIAMLLLGVGLSTPAHAQTSVSTVPTGFMTYSLPATRPGETLTTYLSFPLLANPVAVGPVASFTANSVTITGAAWTAGQFTATPHYVRVVTGNQAGRSLRVTANTATTLTLDITDRSTQSVALDAAGFALAAGDRVEVVPADTLASLFGDGTVNNPLLLTGGANAFVADTVSIYNPAALRWEAYYFNTTRNAWNLSSGTTSQNDLLIPADVAVGVTRRPNRAAVTFQILGRVPEVAPRLKTEGGNSSIRYTSTRIPVPTTLSALTFNGWTKADNAFTADTISVWNPTALRWDAYYQRATDSRWRRSGDNVTDQSDLVLPPGSVIAVLKRSALSGAASFLSAPLPYNLN